MIQSRPPKPAKIVQGFPIPKIAPDKDSFEGDFHIICASGLGNHFYDFGLAITLKEYYPKAHIILWGSTHHREFEERLKNITIRWYRVTSKENSNFELSYDLPFTYKKAAEEISQNHHNGIDSYVASAPFFPDGLSPFLGETIWETPYRVLGLPNEMTRSLRPFVPVEESDRVEIRRWLAKNNLLGQPYIVMTPHVVPMKAWGLSGFSRLASRIYDRYGLRTIFTGFPDSPSLNVQGSLEPYGIPLTQVAALIEGSRLYVGHDSGLTHMALSFSIPTLTIFVDRKVPPPFIRAPIPENTSFVAPFCGLDLNRSVEGAFSWVRNILEGTALQAPVCPLCRGTAYFLLDALENRSVWICSCGTSLRVGHEASDLPENEVPSLSTPFPFPERAQDLLHLEKRLPSGPQTLSLTASVFSSLEGLPVLDALSERHVDQIPSWEGIFSFMERGGYYPMATSWTHLGIRWNGTFRFSRTRSRVSFFLPFGEKMVRVPSYEVAMRHYRSLPWRDEDDFSRLWKKLAEWHYNTDARRMAIETFRLKPTPRNLRNIIRAFLMTREPFLKK